MKPKTDINPKPSKLKKEEPEISSEDKPYTILDYPFVIMNGKMYEIMSKEDVKEELRSHFLKKKGRRKMNVITFESSMREINIDFSCKLDKIYQELEDFTTAYYESASENILVTEKEAEAFSIKVKKFFSDMVTMIENLKTSLQTLIMKKTQEKEFQNRLNKLYQELKEKQESGLKKVEVVDVWKYVDTFVKMNDDLSKYVRKFTKVKYTRTSDIDKDIASFNSIVDSYEKKLEEISKEKVKVSIKKMIGFVEDEISNRSRLMKILNDNIILFKEFQNEATTIEKRKDILGPEILPKHVGLLRRISYGIVNFIKKWVIRIMTAVILIV